MSAERDYVERIKVLAIERGIAEVEREYDDGPRKAGAVEGFGIARGLHEREEYVRVIDARHRREVRLRRRVMSGDDPTDDVEDRYWHHRYATLQVEWVFKLMLVLWGAPIVSSRAAREVIEIVRELREEIGDERGV